MFSLENNPFRILGTTANATLKELKSSEVTIKRYIDIGKSPVLRFDLTPPMTPITRSLEDITKAKNQIHTPKDKLVQSLFWFISSGPIDDIALNKLTESKDTVDALETFRKGAKEFKISLKSASCILNHSTLDLILYNEHKDETKLFQALRRKLELLSNKDIINHFEFLITSDKHKIKYSEVKEEVFDKIKTILKEVFPRRKQSNLLLSIIPSNSDFKKEIEDEIINDLMKSVNTQINKFDNVFKSNEIPNGAFGLDKTKNKNAILNSGKELVDKSKKHYKQLLDHIKHNDYQFEKVINDVFGRANISVIHSFNAEMDYINHMASIGLDYTKSSDFDVYETNIKHFKTQVAPYDLDIKNTINENHTAIKKVCADIREVKNRNRSNYSGGSSSPQWRSGSSYSGNNGVDNDLTWLWWLIGIILFLAMIAS